CSESVAVALVASVVGGGGGGHPSPGSWDRRTAAQQRLDGRNARPGAARRGDGAGRYESALDLSDLESIGRTWLSQRQRSHRPFEFLGLAAAIAYHGSSWHVAGS